MKQKKLMKNNVMIDNKNYIYNICNKFHDYFNIMYAHP